MEEEINTSLSPICIPENKIRVFESNIQAQLANFKNKVSDTTLLETYDVCDNVRDQILYYEDEPQLSETQNSCRRIFIASDLLISICSIYEDIVDNEFTKIINNMVQWEKYKKLSRKIMKNMQLERKREKYFADEAESKLLKSLEGAEEEKEGRESAQRPLEASEQVTSAMEITEQVTSAMEITEQVTSAMEITEQVTSAMEITGQVTTPMEVTEQALIPMAGTGKEVATVFETENSPVETAPAETFTEVPEIAPVYETSLPPLESTIRDETLSRISGNLTEIRAEPATDVSRLEDRISTILRQDLSLPDTGAEPSIREPVEQDRSDDDLNHILQILEGQIFEKEVADIPQPVEPTDRVQEAPIVERLQTDDEKPAEESERSEEWNLPSLEPIEKTRKQSRLIIDEVTIIPEYAARALHLNRNINIQRVQVFEGPPNILQGISTNYLMRAPGLKSSMFKDVRSSRLNALYSRHLKVEKKPVEPVLPWSVVEKKRDDVSKARATVEIVEEVGERAGMLSEFEKSAVLAELLPDRSRLEDLASEIPPVPLKESMIGMPVSRIISSIIEPPEKAQMEIINAAPTLPAPRVQQLQGKSIDPKPTSSWFHSSKKNPPSGKYREFNYIYKKLVQYWSLFEIQGMEKCITLREFFSFEEDASLANYLTALRIVDKLSIQRKLLLEFKNNDVFIRPFENPYASGRQLLLKEKEPLF